MKKLLLPLFLLITGCGDIITKIEKDDIPAYENDTSPVYKVDELSHIQVTVEEAKQDILDCVLYFYLQNPVDDSIGGQLDYENSVYRLTRIAKQYAQRGQQEKGDLLFDAAGKIANKYLKNHPALHLSELYHSDQSQPAVDQLKELEEEAVAAHQLISNTTDRNAIREWTDWTALNLIQTKRFDLVQNFAPKLFEHDRIKILSKTVIAMHEANLHTEARNLLSTLRRDLLNIDNRERRAIPKQKLNAYAHVIAAYHALDILDVKEELFDIMIATIQSDPPLRTRDFIEAARIFAYEYQLFDESYTLIQLANGNFDSINENDLYLTAKVFINSGRREQANEIAHSIKNRFYQSLYLTNAADLDFDNGNIDLWNQKIQKVTGLIDEMSDNSKVYVYYQLAKSYAKANKVEKMYDTLVQAIQIMKSEKMIPKAIHLIFESEILREYNDPTKKATQAKRNGIAE